MGRIKIAAALLAAVCLLILFALLPGVVSAITDTRLNNSSGVSRLTPITADTAKQEGRLSVRQKLLLVETGVAYSIGEGQTRSTASQALGWVEALVDQLADDMKWKEQLHYQLEPVLIVDEENTGHLGMFWTIRITVADGSGAELLLVADDETGMIVGMRCDTAGSLPRHVNYAPVLQELFAVYVRQLNMQTVNLEKAEPSAAEAPYGWEDQTTGFSTSYAALRDQDGQEIVVAFTVYPDWSFHTEAIY